MTDEQEDGPCQACGGVGCMHCDARYLMVSDKASNGEIVQWADKAQFHAEDHGEVENDGVQPVVHLLAMNPDPLGAMAAMNEMYIGHVVRDMADVTDDQRRKVLDDMTKTTLTAPMEAVDMMFLYEGVDRAFTHQDVRQRTAVFAQESLRFAVPGSLLEATTLPPSLVGTLSFSSLVGDEVPRQGQGPQQAMRNKWDEALEVLDETYHFLVDNGMPAEEARGLLPHCVATRMIHKSNLRNEVDHSGVRLCTQAQFHWRSVWAQKINAIRSYPFNNGFSSVAVKDRWQFEEIANAKWFRPICYQTGKCEFKGSADRACSIRERVDAREASGSHAGAENNYWEKPLLGTPDDMSYVDYGILPEEWLLNPAAARSK